MIAASLGAIAIALPLGAFAWQASQPISMGECPLDRIVFADGWLKNSPDSQMLRVTRVGQTEWGLCSGEHVSWKKEHAVDANCRGPYGDTVFEADYRPEGEGAFVKDVYATWHTEPGAPCCWWNIHSRDTAADILADERFRWNAAGQAPPLASMPFNEIKTDQYSEINDDRWSGGKTLTASECRVDFAGRLQMSARKIGGWFSKSPDEEIYEEMERDLEQREGG